MAAELCHHCGKSLDQIAATWCNGNLDAARALHYGSHEEALRAQIVETALHLVGERAKPEELKTFLSALRADVKRYETYWKGFQGER